MTSNEDNTEIQAGLKLVEPFLVVTILTFIDYLFVYKLHQVFPYQSSLFPPAIGFYWNNYFFTFGILIQSLIFYAIAVRYRQPAAAEE